MTTTSTDLSHEKDLDHRIAEHVRLQLRIADIKQATVHRTLGHSRSTSYRRLHGERPITGADLVMIAKLAGTSVTDLFPEELRS